MARTEQERAFDLFGSRVRILVGEPADREDRLSSLPGFEVEALLRGVHRELTRFDPESGISRLNADRAPVVRTSATVARLVAASQTAARESHGLVDASLVGELERAGYATSRIGAEPADLLAALAAAPPRRPAGAATGGRWDEVHVDLAERTVSRPPGMRFDAGGVGKGLAADLAAAWLSGYSSFAVDCGGDIRTGGRAGQERLVEVVPALGSGVTHRVMTAEGGVATSGLRTRIWRHGSGYRHHLIDPATGEPAWTGVIQATAFAPTATRAEMLAKSALLSGPEGARSVLDGHGGLIVLDSGEVEVVGDIELCAEEQRVVA